MSNSFLNIPQPVNEPVLGFEAGSKEKTELKNKLEELSKQQIEIPMIIGGKEVRSGNMAECIMPHNHKHVLAKYHKGNPEHVKMAIDAAAKAWKDWSVMPWEARAEIFLKMADLLAGKYRQTLNAACMLGQSKTCHQAEIDSACELIDFFRFNVCFAQEMFKHQPLSVDGVQNSCEYRPMEGFVFAVTPFNFVSIAGNLPTAPALMGNTVLWKPASTGVYPAYFLMKLFEKAGLPDGVINMIPGPGRQIGDPVMNHPDLAGVHFTGSTPVFQNMWKTVGNNIANYKTYPRIVGETGGKNFICVHPSADSLEVATAIVRGSFEYQGQKCSAASRCYIPRSLWSGISDHISKMLSEMKVGDVADFRNFMGAVIDKDSFDNIKSYIEYAKKSPESEIVFGGECDDSVGYFVKPTVILTTNPKSKTMVEEIFGPVVTIYVYEDSNFEKTLHLCDGTSQYALTGAIISKDRNAVEMAHRILRHAAGNFYINDKPTGAVVGQQPFGGSRASGTNDKAGSMWNLLRWVSIRTVKETFGPATDFKYPFMNER
ncbi:L-glutamate gamma-semialdehyde dehydrogenase [bacterium]|nr:L-glutamate gamma-semialdehyde dehydrogenase [bacterium]